MTQGMVSLKVHVWVGECSREVPCSRLQSHSGIGDGVD
jgi:hypothetical protein